MNVRPGVAKDGLTDMLDLLAFILAKKVERFTLRFFSPSTYRYQQNCS
jgi:hypothetical protein